MAVLGWKYGILVGAHDIGKSALAVILAQLIFPNLPYIGAIAGVASVLGHIFPFYLKFKGGKGFASYIGMMLMMNWQFGLCVLAVVVVSTLIFDHLTIGTTITVLSLPVFLLVSQAGWLSVLTVSVATAVIIAKHWENYVRMANGTEFGLRKTLKKEYRAEEKVGER